MQVTNKRLLIRAPGRILLRGRTCLQYDFNINEIGGVDVRKSYKFSLFNLIAAWIVAPFLAGIVLSLIMLLLFQNLDFDRFSSNINFFQKLMLLIFGPEVIFGLTAAILLGTIIGTYSSIYISAPMLVWLKVGPDSFVSHAPAQGERVTSRNETFGG